MSHGGAGGAHCSVVMLIMMLIMPCPHTPITHFSSQHRGYTRKEPYATGPWTPMAENWNGRCVGVCVAVVMLMFLPGVTVSALCLQAVLWSGQSSV